MKRPTVGRSGLVDNWLDAASKSPDMSVRGNAVIALVAMGGQQRMVMLARLIARTAKEVRDGQPNRLEVIGLARREVEPSRLSAIDRKALDDILDRGDDEIDVANWNTVRGIVREGKARRQRKAYRRLEPRSTFNLSLVPAIARQTALGTLFIGFCLWAISQFIYSVGLPFDGSSVLFGLWLVLLACICGLVAAGLMTPAMPTTGGIVLDAAIIAVVTSAIPVSFLLFWDWFADARDPGSSAWLLLGVMTLPGLGWLRLSTPSVSSDDDPVTRLWPLGLPLLWTSIVAGVVVFVERLDIPHRIDSAGTAWTVSVAILLAAHAGLIKRGERWPKTFRANGPRWVKRLGPWGVPALAATCCAVLALPAINREFTMAPLLETPINDVSNPTIPLTLNVPVQLRPKEGLSLKVGIQSPVSAAARDLRVRVSSRKGAVRTVMFFNVSKLSSGSGQESLSPADSIDVCLTGKTECGQSGGIEAWPRIYVGDPYGEADGGALRGTAVDLLVTPDVPPSKPGG